MTFKKKILTAVVAGVALFGIKALIDYNNVAEGVGDLVGANPLPIILQPQHPYLNGERTSMHRGSYNQDISSYPGPLGHNLRSEHNLFNPIIGVAPNVSFDNKGRAVTVGMELTELVLYLLDPETLESLTEWRLPGKVIMGESAGGGYFHMDEKGRAILAPPQDKTIRYLEVVETATGPEWHVAETIDLKQVLPEEANIHDVIPDWNGNLWFISGTGFVGYRETATGQYFTYQMDKSEAIQNSFALDEEGVYIVSSDALYQFKTRDNGEVYLSWRADYENGETQKPGTLSHGSGTSPTLIGEDLVAIGDDGAPFTNVTVWQRGENIEGDRLVCKVPVFEANKSATENSLSVYGNSIVVQNDYGHVFAGDATTTEPGVWRIDVREDRSGCDVVWKNDMVSHSLPHLSMPTGLIYIYTFEKPYGHSIFGGWYLTAVDFRTGERVWDRLIGKGTGGMTDMYSSVTTPLVLGPNGAGYIGIRTGVVLVKDGE